MSGWLTDRPDWAFDGPWCRWAGGCVALIAGALAVTFVVPALRRHLFGLVERCWYVAAIIWLTLTAAGLLLR